MLYELLQRLEKALSTRTRNSWVCRWYTTGMKFRPSEFSGRTLANRGSLRERINTLRSQHVDLAPWLGGPARMLGQIFSRTILSTRPRTYYITSRFYPLYAQDFLSNSQSTDRSMSWIFIPRIITKEQGESNYRISLEKCSQHHATLVWRIQFLIISSMEI